jgi:hypothetical protein
LRKILKTVLCAIASLLVCRSAFKGKQAGATSAAWLLSGLREPILLTTERSLNASHTTYKLNAARLRNFLPVMLPFAPIAVRSKLRCDLSILPRALFSLP